MQVTSQTPFHASTSTLRTLLYTLTISALVLEACTGGKGVLRFDELSYPVSTSAFLFGKDYELLQKGRDLEVVGSFHYAARIRGFGWKPYGSSTVELGKAMNRSIEKDGGEGMVNLTVSTGPCGLGVMYGILLYIPSIIPFMPGCAVVTAEGQIVRQKEAASITTPVEAGAKIDPRSLPRYLPPVQEVTLALFKACTSLGTAGFQVGRPWKGYARRQALEMMIESPVVVTSESLPYIYDEQGKHSAFPYIDARAAAMGANAVQFFHFGSKEASSLDSTALIPENGPYEFWQFDTDTTGKQTQQATGPGSVAPSTASTDSIGEAQAEREVGVVFGRFWKCPLGSPLLKAPPPPPPPQEMPSGGSTW